MSIAPATASEKKGMHCFCSTVVYLARRRVIFVQEKTHQVVCMRVCYK